MASYCLLLTFLLFVRETLSCSCPDAWTLFGNSCYFHGHDELSFLDSERFCQHRAAHLVHIENAAENAFLKSYLGDLKDSQHWIGLTDQDIEGVWQWYDTNTIATYLNWNPGDPNGGTRDNCGVIMAEYGNNWVDNYCGEHFRPLCEKPCIPCVLLG